ncbi:MAG: hypothetical protein OHK0024_17780 [Thalassobaculales bacterium]
MSSAAIVIDLAGDAYARGRCQALAAPEAVPAVREAVDSRMAAAGYMARPDIVAFLSRQHAFAGSADPEGLAEVAGIADGFGIAPRRLFDYLHLGLAADLAAAPPPVADGCTALAFARRGGGAVVAKNRDFRGEHLALQRVFRHRDPAWGGRSMICVGSLGAPGAYSSGINSDGLALADTQIATDDHGIGLLRYFVMTRLLTGCADVAAAKAMLRSLPHAGGGSLVMADAGGAVAAVEIGHRVLDIERPADRRVARTNRFVSPALAGRTLPAGEVDTSEARLARVRAWLAEGHEGEAALRALLSGHDSAGGGDGLCRHHLPGGSRTISGVIFDTARPGAMFCPDRPCAGPWLTVGMA